jgi:hypothetical protein
MCASADNKTNEERKKRKKDGRSMYEEASPQHLLLVPVNECKVRVLTSYTSYSPPS